VDPLQRALVDACLDARAGGAIAGDLHGFLAAHGVTGDDAAAILAAPRRLLVYRSLVRNGLSAVVLRMLPRTRARLNAARAGRFDGDLAAFVDEVGPRTHYLRDVPAELVAWATPAWRADPAVPAYLPDLAAHELAHFAVSGAAASALAPGEIAVDRPLAFCGSARVERYAWAVHELRGDLDATDEPARRDVCLLAHRDRAHEVRWLELTPLAAAVVERLLAGEPLGDAVTRACTEHGARSADVSVNVARLLADLAERGVVLGSR
jgi:hypothetical protein